MSIRIKIIIGNIIYILYIYIYYNIKFYLNIKYMCRIYISLSEFRILTLHGCKRIIIAPPNRHNTPYK